MTYAAPSGNITDMTGMFGWLNTSIDNWFFPGMIITVYFIILLKLMFNSGEVAKSVAAASFICMIISVLLRITGLINTTFMGIFIILTGVSVVWMYMESR
jgi:hypothetical protein